MSLSLNIGHGEWIGVDFDGTLAHYESKQFPALGNPVLAMVSRVKAWHAQGIEVRIVTARVGLRRPDNERIEQTLLIQEWCQKHLGFKPRVVCDKDFDMAVLFDDRCIQVEKNTGRLIGEDNGLVG